MAAAPGRQVMHRCLTGRIGTWLVHKCRSPQALRCGLPWCLLTVFGKPQGVDRTDKSAQECFHTARRLTATQKSGIRRPYLLHSCCVGLGGCLACAIELDSKLIIPCLKFSSLRTQIGSEMAFPGLYNARTSCRAVENVKLCQIDEFC